MSQTNGPWPPLQDKVSELVHAEGSLQEVAVVIIGLDI